MANLRTNNLSGEQGQNAYRGSVYFQGYIDGSTSSYLSIADNDDLDMGTGDFTFEAWIRPVKHQGTNNPNYMGFFSSEDYANSGGSITIQVKNDGTLRYLINGGTGDEENGSTVLWGHYHHVAIVRSSGTIKGYVDGVEEISSSYSSAVDFTHGGSTVIGELAIDNYAGDYPFRGHISNLRLVKGTAVYTAAFTPPTSELTIIPNTVLLCCQNSEDPTQEATGKTITANGNLADADLVRETPKVIPPVGVDAGNTFGGSIQQSSQGYMYFPTGRTEERGRGRGLFNGGGGPINTIQYIQIQSSGNSQDFGDLTSARDLMGSAASSVRGVSGGQGSPTYSNTIDFVTISTTANAIDFGDLLNPNYTPGALASDTRAVWGGGATPVDNTEDTIQFATIATTGNTQDFGNLTVGRRHVGGLSSPTRGVYGAGASPGVTNVMDFITIASTGDATDFGDMTETKNDTAGCSNATRGLFIGGDSGVKNTIEFITIATTGNGTDFGDLIAGIRYGAGLSDSIRGLFEGGAAPGNSARNTIDFVTIETTGNSQDFGDLFTALYYPSACSDSHGGLS